MVTIETDHGRFEADTIRSAEKLARKAEREAAKLANIRSAKQKIAKTYALAQAWSIARRKMGEDGGGFPRGWGFHALGADYCALRVKQGEFSKTQIVSVETEQGRAECELWDVELLGSVENGAGFTIAIVYKDRCCPKDPMRFCAVGVHDTELALELMPNVDFNEFIHPAR